MTSDHNSITLRIALSEEAEIKIMHKKSLPDKVTSVPEEISAPPDSNTMIYDEVSCISLSKYDLQSLDGQNWLNDQVTII